MLSFLLVSLSIDAILGEMTVHQRRKKLEGMTKGDGLGDAYAATLSRIKAQHRSRSILGMQVLMWVSHSERPLRVEELCHALGVEEGSTDLNTQNIPAREALIACCLGLIMVEKSSSTVRLVHYTLQEYLSRDSNLFLNSHSTIAEVCLTYLSFREVRSISSTLHSVPPTVPFVEYASCYWGAHARRETTESVKNLAVKLLDGFDKHISSKVLLLHEMGIWGRRFDRGDSSWGFTGLHGAAYFGCVEITVALLGIGKWDTRTTDCHGNTAIAWAVRRGHEEAARILLDRNEVHPNTTDEYGRTLLSCAAQNGHEGVVRILLERNDVNPNTASKYGETPLSRAAENGHEDVVRLLLERNDVNPDTADKYGQTPLWRAAQNGYEKVMRMLLERRDINPDVADTLFGQTPLSQAAENGHEGVVRMLLERNDVNPNAADILLGQTPLSRAALNGHDGVVRLLAERDDVNPEKPENCGQALVSRAAQDGHEKIPKLLRRRIDPISRYTASSQSTELFIPKPSDLSEPLPKRIRRS